MPRPRNESLLALYKINDLDQIVCYNGKCDGKVLYRHSANLERHLKLLHPSIYSSYIKKKKIFKFPRKPNFEKRLIDVIRLYPILWNKLDKNSFNEGLKKRAWKEISKHLEESVRRCKMKWSNMMEKFKSELILVSQTIPVTETTVKSNWKYFSELLFMRDHIEELTTINSPSDQMESIEIKEESSESFQLYNEALEDSSQLEYGDESVQCDREDSRLLNEIEESIRQEDKNADRPGTPNDKEASRMPDDFEGSKLKNQAQISTNQYKKRQVLDETDGDESDEYFDTKVKTLKRKKIEAENGDINDLDSDRMFLLSLLPFLQAIPQRKKLFARHRIQGVLLEEQPNSEKS